MGRLQALYEEPHPIRRGLRKLARRLDVGTFEQQVRYGVLSRPAYGYCLWQAADLARRLQYPSISVIEFGVAGGNGLLVLEDYAASVSAATGVNIDVYGFDTGEGLPTTTDYRDMPYRWKGGDFKMETSALEARLSRAHLVIGDVKDTVPRFFEETNRSPIGAVYFDLDLYTATRDALTILELGEEHHLPRLPCYFDDILGSSLALFNDYTGERLAIHEFNSVHKWQKLSPAYHLISRAQLFPWYHKVFHFHDFVHSRYSEFVSTDQTSQLPLNFALRRSPMP